MSGLGTLLFGSNATYRRRLKHGVLYCFVDYEERLTIIWGI